MKYRILGDENTIETVKKSMMNNDIEFVLEDEDFIVQPSTSLDKIIGRNGDNIYIIEPKDIIYFEAEGNDTVCVTENITCYVKEKIYQIEASFYGKGFIQISRFHVINSKKIKSIKPQSNMKFKLYMTTDKTIEVTRSYYYIFKEFLGI